jgi:large subunit ribosomal protein L17
MRHRRFGKQLSRSSSHRLALRRNLAQSLFEHGQVRTTLVKAKETRPFVERLITLARKAHDGSLAARQRLVSVLNDRAIIAQEHQEDYLGLSDAQRQKVLRSRSGRRHRTGQPRPGREYTAQSVIHKLINEVAPQFDGRPGGYTRIIKLPDRRIGDNGELAILQLVGTETRATDVPKSKGTTARKRRIDGRYDLVERLAKKSKPKGQKKPKAETEPQPEAAEQTEAAEDQTKEQPEEKAE